MSLLLPFIVPITASLLSVFLRGRLLISFNLLSSFVLLVTAISVFLEVASYGSKSVVLGNWPIPYGIEFYVDEISAILILLIALLSAVVMVFLMSLKSKVDAVLFALTQCLIAAVIAISLASDLFNLYVWFELTLIAVLGLMVHGQGRHHTEAALKYFAVSMVGTLIMLSAIGLIHGATGHLNFGSLAESSSAQVMSYSGLLLIALLLKIGAFPLFIWLPAAYHALPAPILALVGGLLTKVFVYVLIRLDGQVLNFQLYHEALGWLAVVTMVSGVLGAAYHWDLRRILAFHIVSQVGFLLLGISLASTTGTTFFLFHNILVKANLFLIAGLIWFTAGHYDLRKIGGLYPARPLLALMFLLSGLSLVGVPATSGFWGKLMIIMEAFTQQNYVWAAAALITGILTLYSMSKIWLEAFWKPHPEGGVLNVVIPKQVYFVMLLMSLVILILGLIPEPIIALIQQYAG